MGGNIRDSEYLATQLPSHTKKGVSTPASFGLSILCCLLVFSTLQMYKNPLASTRLMTLIAGYVASWLFIFMLTAVSNLENIVFGKGFQARVIPEVALCMVLACSAAGMVHRVSVTVCLLCSMVGLYYINKMGQSSTTPAAPSVSGSKKKK
ncbi:keratinocyte-associated protein 2-like isoform X2 [Eriocheir sinensis]|uniref:keratinocyte-associated protein 2-like isoform X2 n=1 Tax=Eriocheir sinensis TaxID=95602 RepID=UPI0021C6330C|nr:keratinocyte-associated protein 2-like isoform X2 [Eriocheir sinensis]